MMVTLSKLRFLDIKANFGNQHKEPLLKFVIIYCTVTVIRTINQ